MNYQKHNQRNMQYLLFDKALHDEYTFYVLTQQFPVFESLFKETEHESLIEVAPYIFVIDQNWKQQIASIPHAKFDSYLIVESEKELTAFRKHLQQFIYQQVEGKNYFFRIWDGHVLEKFLPTCNLEQLRMFYKNIEAISFEDIVGKKQLIFEVNQAKVVIKKVLIEEKIQAAITPQEQEIPVPKIEGKQARKWL